MEDYMTKMRREHLQQDFAGGPQLGKQRLPAEQAQMLQELRAKEGTAPVPPEPTGVEAVIHTIGRPIGYVVSKLIPAWAEFVTSPLVGSAIQSKYGTGAYNDWMNERAKSGDFWKGVWDGIGKGDWSQAAKAIDAWSTARKERPGLFYGEKILFELAVDPTTYMGWGVASRIPLAGKFLGAIFDVAPRAAWYNTFGRAAKFVRQGAGHVPGLNILFTPSTQTKANRAVESARQGIEGMFGTRAMQSNNPEDTARLLKDLQIYRAAGGPPPAEFLRNAAEELGTDITGIGPLHEFAEMLKDPEATAKAMEAMALVEKHVGRWGATKSAYRDVMTEWFEDASTMSPERLVAAVQKLVNAETRAIGDEAIEALKHSESMVKSLIWRAWDYGHGLMEGKIAKWAVTEPARAMLIFFNYGPFNTWEDSFRSVLGGKWPSMMSPEYLRTVWAGSEVPETLAKLDPLAASELGQWFKGLAEAGTGVEFASGKIPGLAHLTEFMSNYNQVFQKWGAQIRRGYWHKEAMDAMMRGLQDSGIAMRPEFQSVYGIAKVGAGLGDKRADKMLTDMAMIAVMRGESSAIRDVLPNVFAKGNLDKRALWETLDKYMPGMPHSAKQKVVDTLSSRGLSAFDEGLDEAVKDIGRDYLKASPDALDEALKRHIEILRTTKAESPGQAIAAIDIAVEVMSKWLVMPREILEALKRASGKGKPESWEEWTRLRTRLSEVVESRWSELQSALKHATVDAVPKGMDPVAHQHWTKALTDLHDWPGRIRDSFHEFLEQDLGVSHTMFPNPGGIEQWDDYVSELAQGNLRPLSDRTFPKTWAAVLRRPYGPSQPYTRTTEWKAGGVGIEGMLGRLKAQGLTGDKLTNKAKQEIKWAFWEAHSEARSGVGSAYTKKITKNWQTAINAFHDARGWANDFGDAPFDEMRRQAVKASDEALRSARADATTNIETSMWALMEEEIDMGLEECHKVLIKGTIGKTDAAKVEGFVSQIAAGIDSMKAKSPDIAELFVINNRKATDEATHLWKMAYPNYDDTVDVDDAIRTIAPFWIYQSRSWPWLLGQWIAHPSVGLMTAPEGRLWQWTDEGYMPESVFGTQVAPLRGTVFGRLRRTFRGPYPPQYSGMMGTFERMTEFGERFGFYPGIHVSVPISLALGILGTSAGTEGTVDELASVMVEAMPPMLASASDAFIAASRVVSPDVTIKLSDTLFKSRFREYYMAKALWDSHKITPTRAARLGHKDWIADAYFRVSVTQLLEEQLSLTRFNPEGWQTIEDNLAKVTTELTGLTADQQAEIRRSGHRIDEYVSLNRIDRSKLAQVEGYQARAEASRPLSPPERRAYMDALSEFYGMLDEWRTASNEEQAMDDQKLLSGWMTARQWRENYSDRGTEYRTEAKALLESHFIGDRIGRTSTERQAIREKFQLIPSIVNPVDVVLDAMFALEPAYDSSGEPDYTGMFQAQEEIIGMLPESDQREVHAYLEKNQTPMVREFRAGRAFMDPYWDVETYIPQWYRAQGYTQEADQIASWFTQLRQADLDFQQSRMSGYPFEIAAEARNRPYLSTLQRHVDNWRWSLENDTSNPFYDQRVPGFLNKFYPERKPKT